MNVYEENLQEALDCSLSITKRFFEHFSQVHTLASFALRGEQDLSETQVREIQRAVHYLISAELEGLQNYLNVFSNRDKG